MTILSVLLGGTVAALAHSAVRPLLRCVNRRPIQSAAAQDAEWEKILDSESARTGNRILGWLEIVVYFTCLAAGAFTALAGVLAFKVASKWAVWHHIEKIPDDFDKRDNSFSNWVVRDALATYYLQKFLIGTFANLVAAICGYGVALLAESTAAAAASSAPAIITTGWTASDTINLITALATFCGLAFAVYLALDGERLRAVRTRPSLRLEPHESFHGHLSGLVSGEQTVGEAMNYQWRVVNDKKWTEAKGVEIALIGVQRRDWSGPWQSMQGLPPLPFFWAPGWAGLGKRKDLRGTFDLVDFCRVEKPSAGPASVALCLVDSQTFGRLSGPGALRCWVEVRGDNFPGSTHVFEIRWDGGWDKSPEKMVDHLKICNVPIDEAHHQ